MDLWFSSLARRGVTRLSVRSGDLAADGDGLREVWSPSEVFLSKRFQERQDRQLRALAKTGVWDEAEGLAISSILARTERPWRVYYDRRARTTRLRRTSLQTSQEALRDALIAARDFSRRHRLGYVGTFSRSLALLTSRRPAAAYPSDLLPPYGYSLDARQVFAAASNAWVFGGMGAFGDVVFEDEAVATAFWALYRDLGAAVVAALLAATNDFDRSQTGRKAV